MTAGANLKSFAASRSAPLPTVFAAERVRENDRCRFETFPRSFSRGVAVDCDRPRRRVISPRNPSFDAAPSTLSAGVTYLPFPVMVCFSSALPELVISGSLFLANVNSRSRSLYAIARPSVVCRL